MLPAAEFADDLDADRGEFGGEAHQAVAVDAQHDDIGSRHHGRDARQVGEDAQFADEPVAAERRHMDQPGRDLDIDLDFAFEDHAGEGAAVPLAHDRLAGRKSGEAAARRDRAQRGRIEPAEDRVQRQHLLDLLDRRRVGRALLRHVD